MNSFRIETLAIGDELLTGRIADTNSAFVAGRFFDHGLRIEQVTVVPDDSKAIWQAMEACAERANAVICFGGLGPTSDDRTAQVVADLLGTELAEDSPSRAYLEKYLKERGRQLTAPALKQVLYPKGCTVLPNTVGMAPGFVAKLAGCQFYFLPGVPQEMKAMFEKSVLGQVLKDSGTTSQIHSQVWRCIGIPEAELQRVMDPVEKKLSPEMVLGYRTRFPENYLYFYHKDSSNKALCENLRKEIEQTLSPFCYSHHERELEEEVLELLQKQKLTIALAESCTGGLTLQRLTRVPGASDRVWGGFVTYQIEAKKEVLGIQLGKPEDAVSAKCSEDLGIATLEKSGADLAAGVTGYMGPTGGTATDPMGRAYLWVGKNKTEFLASKIDLPPRPRSELQWGASAYLLDLIRRFLTK